MYKAWGESRYARGTLPTSFKYTGQRLESSLGIYDYEARWYDATLSRWLQPDTIVPGVGEGDNPNAVGYLGASNYAALAVDYHENQYLDQLSTESKARLLDPDFKLPPVPRNPIAFDRYTYSLNNLIRYVERFKDSNVNQGECCPSIKYEYYMGHYIMPRVLASGM